MDLERCFKFAFVNLEVQLLIFHLKRIIIIRRNNSLLSCICFGYVNSKNTNSQMSQKILNWAQSIHSSLVPNNKYDKSKSLAQILEI